MSETANIDDQLRRAFEGDAWHGPALREILDGISAQGAARRPLGQAHTIWEIVLHISVWQSVVRRRLEGERIVDLPEHEDWPPMPQGGGDEAWQSTRAELEDNYIRLRRAIAAFPETRLGDIVPGKPYSHYVMLHGLVQHDLYHAGQMALLKKAVV